MTGNVITGSIVNKEVVENNLFKIDEINEVDLNENPERILEHKKLVADAFLKHDKKTYFIEPKLYEGSYKWFLEQKKKSKKTEAVELLIKLEKGANLVPFFCL
jgi:hypothetical protein